jgi:hypothetical protein
MTAMAWRLMWHPGLSETDSLMGTPVSFLSDDVANDAEARAMVRQLAVEGFNCISVTATGQGKIMTGSVLKRWLAQAEKRSPDQPDKDQD